MLSFWRSERKCPFKRSLFCVLVVLDLNNWEHLSMLKLAKASAVKRSQSCEALYLPRSWCCVSEDPSLEQISVCVSMALYLNPGASLTVCVLCVICASFYTSVLLVWHLVAHLLLSVWIFSVFVVQDLNLWALSTVSVRCVMCGSNDAVFLFVLHLVVHLLLSV